jgi:phage tail-like protein
VSDLRPFALIRQGDQWVRGAFDNTFLSYEEGIVELAWRNRGEPGDGQPSPSLIAGLAFDNECRLYHSRPDDGEVDLVRWGARDPLAPSAGSGAPTNLFASPHSEIVGDFAGSANAPLGQPRGVAVDENDRLFISDAAGDEILIYDLWSERLLRRVFVAGEHPTDLASHGSVVWVVLAATQRVARVTVGGGPEPLQLPTGCTNPSRVAAAPNGTLAILTDAGSATARIWVLTADGNRGETIDEPYAGDIEWESSTVLVIARQAGADFLRRRVGNPATEEIAPLRARGYDGLGIVRTPDRLDTSGSAECTCGGACACNDATFRIGYWTNRGFRLAIPARLQYERLGRFTTYRLDSGDYQTQWGRVFLDACIPDGTEVCVFATALDEPGDDATLPRTAPKNITHVTILRPDLAPPMPPLALVPAAGSVGGRVHQRESGRERPWTQPPTDDPFRTYEGWIDAPPGRFLWLTLELTGNTQVTPRIRCIRAEHPAHDYLRRLPRVFSRDQDQASFLRRYLAMFEGFLGEVEARGVDRDILLTPHAAPDEVLPWLASFLGLALDERWARAPRPRGRTVDARRDIIELAAWLFRFRGTVPGLRKFIELYVGVSIVLLEHFRFRGRMTALLGGDFQISRDEHAHRFTVLIPAALTEEQLDVVHRILEVHRPAHTIFDVCTVGAGMRAGRGLHVGVSSIVGPTGGFAMLQLGGSALGRGAIIGRPTGGTTPGVSRLGATSRVR